MNKFSITYEQIRMSKQKYMNETFVPQFTFSMHPQALSLLQSNITLFQSSPVERAKRRRNEFWKLRKFLYSSSITSPDVIFLKRKLPKTDIMKYISVKRVNTFISAGIENIIVYRIAYSPSAFPAKRRILVTLSTLMTLAS